MKPSYDKASQSEFKDTKNVKNRQDNGHLKIFNLDNKFNEKMVFNEQNREIKIKYFIGSITKNGALLLKTGKQTYTLFLFKILNYIFKTHLFTHS